MGIFPQVEVKIQNIWKPHLEIDFPLSEQQKGRHYVLSNQTIYV